jgi:hypothetical protein
MNNLREAAQQALELRCLADKFSEGWHDGIKIDASDIILLAEVADALEQPEPAEPEHTMSMYATRADYDAAVAAPTVVEPVAWLELRTLTSGGYSPPSKEWHVTQHPATSNAPRKPLYTHPPRTPLTDEQIFDIAYASQEGLSPRNDTLCFARAIEAAITGGPRNE